MDSIFPVVAIVALALACPLGMAGMGVAAWLVARARGQKKDLSIGCMPGHGEQPSENGQESVRDERIAKLERELDSLKAQGTGRSQS